MIYFLIINSNFFVNIFYKFSVIIKIIILSLINANVYIHLSLIQIFFVNNFYNHINNYFTFLLMQMFMYFYSLIQIFL